MGVLIVPPLTINPHVLTRTSQTTTQGRSDLQATSTRGHEERPEARPSGRSLVGRTDRLNQPRPCSAPRPPPPRDASTDGPPAPAAPGCGPPGQRSTVLWSPWRPRADRSAAPAPIGPTPGTTCAWWSVAPQPPAPRRPRPPAAWHPRPPPGPAGTPWPPATACRPARPGPTWRTPPAASPASCAVAGPPCTSQPR